MQQIQLNIIPFTPVVDSLSFYKENGDKMGQWQTFYNSGKLKSNCIIS